MMTKLNKLLWLCIFIFIMSFPVAYGTVPTTPAAPAAPVVVDPALLSQTEGKDHGGALGKSDGTAAGFKDQRQGIISQWIRDYPSPETLISKYRLNFENNTGYLNAFFDAYRLNYEASYNTAYRNANYAASQPARTNAVADGKALATAESAYMASLDIVRNLSNSWSRAYDELIKKSALETRYRLDRENADYKKIFTETFIDEFRKLYTTAYQKLNTNIELKNINYTLVSMNEARIQVDRVYGEVISGSPSEKIFKSAEIAIPKGAIYEDTFVGFHWIQNSFNGNNTQYEPVSHQYRVTIGNPSGNVRLYKPINISFDFEGSERVGVYEWRYGKWLYVPTIQTADKVSINIPIGIYSGGQYAIFIDNDYKTPRDLAFNWAFKDVITSIRRGHIGSGDFFRPNDAITRGELADMIYRTMGYRTVTPANTLNITDLSKAASYQNGVKYAVGMRFMSLDTQNRFNPNALVTFKEVEIAVSNILMRNFSFSEVATKMLYEKYQRSGYSMNKLGLLKRSEAVYMFNEFVK